MSYEAKFTQAESSGEDGAFTRIDETHPIDIFLGLESRQRTVMIICPKRPGRLPSLAAIQVEARVRGNGGWALVLRLARPDLKLLFTRLVEDLDAATRQQPQDPGAAAIARLSRWQRLLSQGGQGLEDHELRGLAAEIEFLVDEAIPAVGPRAALTGWMGPLDGPKDFVLGACEVEVKAIHQQQRELTISSLEQLTEGGVPLFLWCKEVDLVEVEPSSPASFMALVDRARSAVVEDPAAAELLEEKLRAAGFADREEYRTRGIRPGPALCFRVSGAFPRLRRPEVNPLIASCSYGVMLGGLGSFRVDTWQGVQSDD